MFNQYNNPNVVDKFCPFPDEDGNHCFRKCAWFDSKNDCCLIATAARSIIKAAQQMGAEHE